MRYRFIKTLGGMVLLVALLAGTLGSWAKAVDDAATAAIKGDGGAQVELACGSCSSTNGQDNGGGG
ncbi:MAG: hypothetical protein M3220_04995 [Chloroflexota bacterium]|nr:hypothetical protein [Chloroflexota bacterium]